MLGFKNAAYGGQKTAAFKVFSTSVLMQLYHEYNNKLIKISYDPEFSMKDLGRLS